MSRDDRGPADPRAFRSATAQDPHAPVDPATSGTGEVRDPLRLCVATTVALIAWLVTPPVAVVVFAGMALVAYVRARRAGLLASRCRLGDTRRVMGYLVLALAAGLVGVVQLIARLA